MTTSNERGIALVLVLMIALVVAALSMGAAMVAMNASLISRYTSRQTLLETVADAGLEEWRARINGSDTLYPDTGYVMVEDRFAPRDASGATIPNVYRTVYLGPTGITSGQYGVFGSVVVIAEDPFGNRVVRRGEVQQESFAKFAYFTDVEPSYIAFGGGDQIFGPVHTNDDLKIYPSGATFFGPVTTAEQVVGAAYGTFHQGYTEHVAPVAMPETQELDRLRAQAQAGNTDFVSGAASAYGRAPMRLEFIAIDLNGDGKTSGADEGFVRVYTSPDHRWVTGDVPLSYGNDGLEDSRNCGHYHADGTFQAAADHPAAGPDNWLASVSNSTRRCYLGGSDSLFGAFVADDGIGQWLNWSGAMPAAVAARADGDYLVPVTRALNPSFKGVIFVDGDVAISGVLRGQVTVAATGDIVIADDMTYATDPGAGTCEDMLGVFAGGDVLIADNTLNAPIRPSTGSNYFTYDDTKDEFVHGVLLTLNVFTVENYASGSTRDEPCETQQWGRGCLYLSGGIIQRTRGAVGTIGNPGGTGYLKRYSYDQCAASSPPPYFPTTGHFARGRYFEVDPTGLSVAALFQQLTPGN